MVLIAASIQAINPITPASAAVTYTCAQGGTCAVGDVGPGGGRVFYAPGSVFTMTGAPCASACRYLESARISGAAAFDNTVTYRYLTVSVGYGGAGTAIGTGFSNTSTMIALEPETTKAAGAANAYRGPNNLTDWFLPSKDELATYWSSAPTDATNYYLSSSQASANNPATSIWIVQSGGPYADYNTALRPIIPIRAFNRTAVPSISLSQSTLTAPAGTPVSSYSITSSGGTVGDYSISPNISITPGNGISFDTSTGLISGTPTAPATAVTYTITAANGGGSTTTTFSITVSIGSQTINFAAINGMTTGDVKFLSATSSAGLTITFGSNTTSTCAVNGDKVTATSSGACSLTASQAGNATYAPASATITFMVASNAKNNDEQDALVLALAGVAVGVASMMADVTTIATSMKSCYRGKVTKKVMKTKPCPKGYSTKKSKVSGS